MSTSNYAWMIDTCVPADVVRALLEPYRPFRIEIGFTNGFSTRDYGDESAFVTAEPLAKAFYFENRLTIGAETRVLDVGCHMGYYGHRFVAGGVGNYTGVDFSARMINAAGLLAALAQLDRNRLALEQLDFGGEHSLGTLAKLGVYDIVLCLGSVNNILNLTLALNNLARATVIGGLLVLEYLALDVADAVCEFRKDGLGPDSTLYWIPSERFIDEYMRSQGLHKQDVLVRWEGPAVLAQGHVKVMSLYQRVS